MADAKALACDARGLTVELPDDWIHAEPPKCMAKGPDEVVLVEIHPTGEERAPRSLEMVSGVTAAVLKMTLKYQELGQRTAIPLTNSRAIQRTFVDSAGRHVVQLLIEKDGQFWQLLLQSPMTVWNERRESLLKILHSVEVRPRPQTQ
jgi:hypothetical protein